MVGLVLSLAAGLTHKDAQLVQEPLINSGSNQGCGVLTLKSTLKWVERYCWVGRKETLSVSIRQSVSCVSLLSTDLGIFTSALRGSMSRVEISCQLYWGGRCWLSAISRSLGVESCCRLQDSNVTLDRTQEHPARM